MGSWNQHVIFHSYFTSYLSLTYSAAQDLKLFNETCVLILYKLLRLLISVSLVKRPTIMQTST
ncbi:hypothetical protein KP509_12G067700 [Ceratopteris richardii]|nr:hypothetical protein KP509_12G067700 [Ceratopteris richardii]